MSFVFCSIPCIDRTYVVCFLFFSQACQTVVGGQGDKLISDPCLCDNGGACQLQNADTNTYTCDCTGTDYVGATCDDQPPSPPSCPPVSPFDVYITARPIPVDTVVCPSTSDLNLYVTSLVSLPLPQIQNNKISNTRRFLANKVRFLL